MSGFRITDRRRVRSAIIGGVLAAASVMLLSGCYKIKDTTASIPADYRQRHPITIKETEHSIELFVGSHRGLNASQRADVLAFAQAWKKEATGGIIIDQPVGVPNQLAADYAVREARSILAAAGLPPHAVMVRAYQPRNRIAIATVRFNYPRVRAEAGPCGLWPADLGPTYEPQHYQNKPYWNLGCASQRNLAAMVDNPADLVQPRGENGDAYRVRRNVVLEGYRKGDPTGTRYANPNQGMITDLGR
jgi:pilus assembly protein CpaD